MATKTAEKWQLRVWGDTHPRYASGNMLWTRDYPTRSAANRAAPNVRRMFPDAIGELSRFELASPMGMAFWTCRGVRGRDVMQLWPEAE
jgi:hypothetical protein